MPLNPNNISLITIYKKKKLDNDYDINNGGAL